MKFQLILVNSLKHIRKKILNLFLRKNNLELIVSNGFLTLVLISRKRLSYLSKLQIKSC
jgi:hypothetical protein